MQGLDKYRNVVELDAFLDAQDQQKMKLVDRSALFDSVSYLRSHGFDAQEIELCLVRYFHVDLDLLAEVLTHH